MVGGHSHTVELAPSLLAGNHANLEASLKIIEDAQLNWVHLDIMDGHFVPNLSFGPATIKALRPSSKLYFDTHLMLSAPHTLISKFIKAGSQNITFHVEAHSNIARTISLVNELKAHCGLAINPQTPVSALEPYLSKLELVLVMTVQPGFGGQSFMSHCLDKIRKLSELKQKHRYKYRIQVDGGINKATARQCREAGADTLVAGTAFFKEEDKQSFIASVTQ